MLTACLRNVLFRAQLLTESWVQFRYELVFEVAPKAKEWLLKGV